MAKKPSGSQGTDATPEEFAQVRPRDLHPVADIRLVITDVAKLTERIDNLIERVGELKADGKETRDKIVGVEKSIAGFEGSIKVFGRVYTFALVVVAALLAWILRPVPQAQIPINPPVTSPSQLQSAPQNNGAAEAAPVVDAAAPKGGDPSR